MKLVWDCRHPSKIGLRVVKLGDLFWNDSPPLRHRQVSVCSCTRDDGTVKRKKARRGRLRWDGKWRFYQVIYHLHLPNAASCLQSVTERGGHQKLEGRERILVDKAVSRHWCPDESSTGDKKEDLIFLTAQQSQTSWHDREREKKNKNNMNSRRLVLP